MLDTIFSIFWGIILALSILSIPYIIIRYEINGSSELSVGDRVLVGGCG